MDHGFDASGKVKCAAVQQTRRDAARAVNLFCAFRAQSLPITKGPITLGRVDVHRVLITDAASETNAVKLSSVLQ
jgi:hypothetical protein